MMKRKYNRPTMRVVTLQQQQHLLSGSSGINGEISGYQKSSGGFSQDDDLTRYKSNFSLQQICGGFSQDDDLTE